MYVEHFGLNMNFDDWLTVHHSITFLSPT